MNCDQPANAVFRSTRGSRRNKALRLSRIREQRLRDAVVELMNRATPRNGYFDVVLDSSLVAVRAVDLERLREVLAEKIVPLPKED